MDLDRSTIQTTLISVFRLAQVDGKFARASWCLLGAITEHDRQPLIMKTLMYAFGGKADIRVLVRISSDRLNHVVRRIIHHIGHKGRELPTSEGVVLRANPFPT